MAGDTAALPIAVALHAIDIQRLSLFIIDPAERTCPVACYLRILCLVRMTLMHIDFLTRGLGGNHDAGGIQADSAEVDNYQPSIPTAGKAEVVGENELAILGIDILQAVDVSLTALHVFIQVEVVGQTDGVASWGPGAVAVVNGREHAVVCHVGYLAVVLLNAGRIVGAVSQGQYVLRGRGGDGYGVIGHDQRVGIAVAAEFTFSARVAKRVGSDVACEGVARTVVVEVEAHLFAFTGQELVVVYPVAVPDAREVAGDAADIVLGDAAAADVLHRDALAGGDAVGTLALLICLAQMHADVVAVVEMAFLLVTAINKGHAGGGV